MSVTAQNSKLLSDIQLCSSRSVSRVQMQQFANLSETVTVHRQALTMLVGQLGSGTEGQIGL